MSQTHTHTWVNKGEKQRFGQEIYGSASRRGATDSWRTLPESLTQFRSCIQPPTTPHTHTCRETRSHISTGQSLFGYIDWIFSCPENIINLKAIYFNFACHPKLNNAHNSIKALTSAERKRRLPMTQLPANAPPSTQPSPPALSKSASESNTAEGSGT